MSTHSLSLAAPTQNLRRLLLIRALLLCGLLIACASSYWLLLLPLPYSALLWVLGSLSMLNMATLWRLYRPWPVTEWEFTAQLLLDLLGVGLLLYFSGGASNPFVSYLLLPVCIAAATLRALPSWFIALSAAIIYSALLFYHVSIPALVPHHADHQHPINLHILGMWLNFLISAGLITYFIVDMARALREQEALLHQHREDTLRDEQLLAVATFAAGTAHELGTPLSTMKVLVKDMQTEHSESAQLQADLKLLNDTLNQCSATLRQLAGQAETAKEGEHIAQNLRLYCEHIIDRWMLLNPKVTTDIHLSCPDKPPLAKLHPTLEQSILNLLNNAADACRSCVNIDITLTNQQMIWKITDDGPGIDVELADQLGKPFISNKEKGFGLGLFLSHATINRYGGSIKLYNRPAGGTLAELIIPLTSKEKHNEVSLGR